VYLASSKLNEHGRNDLQLDKYSSSGALLWSQAFSLPDSTSDVLVGDLQVDNAGSVVVTGSVYNGAANGYDMLTAKYSTNGTKLWHSTYNGSASGDDGGAKLYIDGGNNIYVAGAALSTGESMNMLALRYSGSGVQQWAQAVDGHGLYDAAGYLYRRGSELTVVGVVQQTASSWALGSVSFNLSTGTVSAPLSTSSQANFAEVLAVASDAAGNVYVAGYSNGSNGRDIVAAKLSWQLALDWQASYDGPGSGDDEPRAIAVDSSGNVYIAGIAESTAGDSDWLVLKYSSSGALQWAGAYAGAAGSDDGALALSVGPQGEIAAAGYANEHGSKDYLTALLDPADGSFAWSATFNGLANGDDEARQVLVDSTGSITVLGQAAQHGGGSTGMAVRYAKKTLLELPGAPAAAAFVENRGQLADTSGAEVPQVKFYAPGGGAALYVQDSRLSFVLSSMDGDTSTLDTLHRVDMSFHGGKTNPKAFGMGKRDSYHNYYLGHIPEGRARVGLYDKVILSEVYEGVDLQVRAGGKDGGQCFVVKPGGDPSDIKLQFEGQSSLAIDPGTGALEAGSPIGKLLFPQPSAFLMEADGDTEELNWQVAYKLLGDGKVGFDSIGVYDNGKSLVICVGDGDGGIGEDATEDWVEYFGGTKGDYANDLMVKGENGPYVVGHTNSQELPGIGTTIIIGNFDVYLTRYGGGRVIDWVSIVGGAKADVGYGGALRLDGKKVAVVGVTDSEDFPEADASGTTGGDGSSFVFQVSAMDGFLENAKYISGNGVDVITNVAYAAEGDLLLAGFTSSNDFFTQGMPAPAFSFVQENISGVFDGLVAQLSSELEYIWLSYLGGNGNEVITDIKYDEDTGNVFVVGGTTTSVTTIQDNSIGCEATSNGTFPVCKFGEAYLATWSGESDVFIAEFDEDRRLIWSTLLGGSGDENPFGEFLRTRAAVSKGVLAVSGITENTSFPFEEVEGAYNSAHSGVYIALFSGRKLVWSTSFGCEGGGGSVGSGVTSVALDGNERVYLAGSTTCSTPANELDCEVPFNSGEFPVCLGDGNVFFQDGETPFFGGGEDGFIASFDMSGYKLSWATYFGGNEGDVITAIDKSDDGFLYLAGSTSSDEDFPLRNPVNQYVYADGGSDAFVGGLKMPDSGVSQWGFMPEGNNEILAYPNPSHDGFWVVLPRGNSTLNLFSSGGKRVFEEQYLSDGVAPIYLQLGNYPKGIYFLRVENAAHVYFVKLISH
jgi:hypothetical protein